MLKVFKIDHEYPTDLLVHGNEVVNGSYGVEIAKDGQSLTINPPGGKSIQAKFVLDVPREMSDGLRHHHRWWDYNEVFYELEKANLLSRRQGVNYDEHYRDSPYAIAQMKKELKELRKCQQ